MNAEQLIQAVRNLLVGDFDVPQLTPGAGATDAEILQMLNVAQDEMARRCQLYSPSITFSLGAGSSFAFDDAGFSKRLENVTRVTLSSGEELLRIEPSEHNPYNNIHGRRYWFFEGERINVFPALTGTTTGTIQGNWLPKKLVLGSPSVQCELPTEIHEFYLPRYTLAMNAGVFAFEGQQMVRLQNEMQTALAKCDEYRRRTVARRVKARRTNEGYIV